MSNGYRFDVACIINGHNLGDAVIQNRSIERLLRGNFARTLIVWTRPGSIAAYIEHPELCIVSSPFPVGTGQSFGPAEIIAFSKAALKIRKLKPSIALDFFGDFREALFAKFIGAGRYLHVNWAADHPYRRTLRYGRVQLDRNNPIIDSREVSVYRGHEIFVNALLGGESSPVVPSKVRDWPARVLRRVGLHPFASQTCKLWPDENWAELARRILARGLGITVFGSIADRQRIQQIFEPIFSQISVVAGRLSEFFLEMRAVDVLVGLDSLGVHAAERCGVRAIMLAGSNHVDLWKPPHAVSMGASGGCQRYPCFNRPTCRGSLEEFICIRSVGVDDVEQMLFSTEFFGDEIRHV